MTDTETPSSPTELPTLRTSVLRNLGGALALIVLVAAVFGAIGMIGRAETPPTPVAAEPPDDEPAEAPDEPEATEDPEPQPAEEDPEPEPTDEPEEPEEPEEPDADEADEDEAAAADEREEEPEPEPTADETEEPAPPAVAPGDVSIQVLDGYKADGGAAARAVAASLRDGGYRIIAENQALSYDRTAVLWTAGNEAAARQVAAEIGAAEVREQPGNLSSAVDVHVVVGADRG
jgi:hypothetical protein